VDLPIDWQMDLIIDWLFRCSKTGCTNSPLVTCFQASFLLGFIFDPKNGGDIFLRNISWLLTDYMALYPRRQNYSAHHTFYIKTLRQFCFRTFIHWSMINRAWNYYFGSLYYGPSLLHLCFRTLFYFHLRVNMIRNKKQCCWAPVYGYSQIVVWVY
jgi:hypothetical protein